MHKYIVEDIPYSRGLSITDLPEMKPGQSFVYATGTYNETASAYNTIAKIVKRYRNDYRASCRKDTDRRKKGQAKSTIVPTYTVRVYRIEPPKDRV